MGSYIVYRLDGLGKIRGAEWIEAGSDRAALARAARLAEGHAPIGGCEVWQRERRVGRVACPLYSCVGRSPDGLRRSPQISSG